METKAKKLIILANIVLILILLVVVGYTIFTLNTTSQLDITTFDNRSTITISGPSTLAKQVGIGSAHIRLKPGDYYVAAIGSGKKAGIVIHLKSHSQLSLALSPETTPPTTVASVDTVNFTNTDELLNNGVSSSQLANLEQLYFNYKNTAKQITIDTGSVSPGPRDPNSVDFNLSYTGKIDDTPYTAKLVYSGYSVVDLTLTNQAGAQLFHGVLPLDGIEGGHD